MQDSDTTITSEPMTFSPSCRCDPEAQSVVVSFRYTTSDPLVVALEFAGGPTWLLPREVLDPMAAPDPVPGAAIVADWDENALELQLSLRDAEHREIHLVFCAFDPSLNEFVDEMFGLVPLGEEQHQLDWNRLLT
ncbi:SsgA family sporulation/cell division regulator [Saccharopolyspora sp. NPDC000359]|uniref:SsgA family sporulation/cell division regulator n=1 Tax=Saccharopolyspora sp. NPDC000359 TaxID=3154251 RepID=UPI0033208F25